MLVRNKLDAIKKCKKFTLISDQSATPTIYPFISYSQATKRVISMIDKGIYKEPTSFKISEVEPYCTPQEIKKIKDQDKAVVDLTKKLVFNSFEALANYITK